jgi:hypothetical protein
MKIEQKLSSAEFKSIKMSEIIGGVTSLTALPQKHNF